MLPVHIQVVCYHFFDFFQPLPKPMRTSKSMLKLMRNMRLTRLSYLLSPVLLLGASVVHANPGAQFGLAGGVAACGALENPVGPYDYHAARIDQGVYKMLENVERNHLNAKVESLQEGKTSAHAAVDLDYLLRAFPNHPRGLYAMVRWEKAKGMPSIGETRWRTAECYFDRAIRFKADDGLVYMILGLYLHKKDKFPEAIRAYSAAEKLGIESAELSYNKGLSYLKMKRYDDARKAAKAAYAAGYPLPGLKNRLKREGHWR